MFRQRRERGPGRIACMRKRGETEIEARLESSAGYEKGAVSTTFARRPDLLGA